MILEDLLENRDEKYADFNARLIPNIERSRILGVRMPILRKIVKSNYTELEENGFLKELPHRYQEENLIHGIMISEIRNLKLCIRELDRFLPFVDNWAVCDTFSPKIFQKHPKEVYEYIQKWIKSDKTYTIRYAVGLLLSNYLDEHFQKEMLQLVSEVKSEEYYVNMMLAWYFATALAKQYEATMLLIEAKTLPSFVQNKTIQKARESKRISTETKEFLLKFKL